MMTLDTEIEKGVRQISTDAYEMSVGEVVNLYKDGEIEINPAFQRLFRWNNHQKSKFIESLLLRIPIPPVFVFEREDGKWELIDGLQRISTILEFMGELRHPDGGIYEPSVLSGTRYLPSLDGKRWESSNGVGASLSKPQQLAIKRARIGVQILQKKSDESSKYDLFQRLNAGGSVATPQELRNCLMVMLNDKFFEFVRRLSTYKSFSDLVREGKEGAMKQGRIEMATRFLVYLYVAYDKKWDVEEYIDEGVIELSKRPKEEWPKIEDNFKRTFDLIRDAVGKDGLKRFDGSKFTGRVGRVALETIAVGVATNLNRIARASKPKAFVEDRIKNIWAIPEVDEATRPGLRGTQRIRSTLSFGKRWFRP